MAKKNITIEDAKKNKIKLESDILEMIKTFEKNNGIYINYISLDREYEGEDVPQPTTARNRVGKLMNVEASMELDLMY